MQGTIESTVTHTGGEGPAPPNTRAPVSWSKALESVWPYAVAFVVSGGYCWFWFPSHPIAATAKDVLSGATTTATSLFGFLLTSGAILVGIKGSWYKQRAKEAGVYRTLVDTIFTAMWWCLVTAVVSIVARSYDLDWKLRWYRYGLSMWLFCAVLAIGTTTRALRIFARLFKLIASE